MNNKKSFYAIIPATVRYCDSLPANAKLLYGEITALCNEQGFCWANNHYFADLYKVEKETVSRWISKLEKLGFISTEVDVSSGNKRKIFTTDGYRQKSQEVLTKKSRPSCEKSQDPLDKKVKHNITINNTVNNTEREARAFDFLKDNYSFRLEQFEMQHKSQIKNWEKFCLDFNDVVDQEEIKYDGKVLFGRLGRYARNWIQNQNKYSPQDPDPQPLQKPKNFL